MPQRQVVAPAAELSGHHQRRSVGVAQVECHLGEQFLLAGVVILLLVFLRGRRGQFSANNCWDVQGSVIYWHFVDVAWVFIYPTLYLVGS